MPSKLDLVRLKRERVVKVTYHGYVVVLFDKSDYLVELVLEIVHPHVADVCALACIVIQEGQLVFVVLLQKEWF